jgi:hypothetical protein
LDLAGNDHDIASVFYDKAVSGADLIETMAPGFAATRGRIGD